MIILAQVINSLSQILVLLVFVATILSYFMDPYHPVRRGFDNIVQPMLNPIRRIVPPVGGLDFSPFILIVLIQILSNLIIRMIT